MKRFIIVGAGIAGLSFAYECLLRGFQVLLVEKDCSIGGLAKSITHNDCQLDIGVHIFYGRDQEVLQKVKEVVDPDKWVKVKRKGRLYLKGRYVDWPLQLTAVYQLPFFFVLRVLRDQISIKKTTTFTSSNFQHELLQIYGPTLYYSFFHPITKRFLKTDPQRIHPDWAFSSIRAATKIEDKSFSESYKYLTETTDIKSKKEFNLIKFLVQSITANRSDEPFYYFKNGFGTLPESYKERILRLGGRIMTNATVDAFVFEQNSIRQCIVNGRKHDCDNVIWTGNLSDLCRLLNIEDPRLPYIHSKFVYFFLRNCNKDHQVCYYADEDVSFVRGTILSNHSKTIIGNNKISDLLCLEYTFKTKEEMFNSSKVQIAKEDIVRVGLINDNSSVESVFELNVPFSYPVLTIDYREKITDLQNQLDKYDNISTLGRQGTFSYENADVIIKEVINHPMFKSSAERVRI